MNTIKHNNQQEQTTQTIEIKRLTFNAWSDNTIINIHTGKQNQQKQLGREMQSRPWLQRKSIKNLFLSDHNTRFFVRT